MEPDHHCKTGLPSSGIPVGAKPKSHTSRNPKPVTMNYFLAALKKYADFNGRSRRSEYWYFVLFSTIISILLAVADSAGTIYLDTVYSLAVLVPSIAVGVRRMHDVDKSGWYILIPFYNLVLACTEGSPGFNRFGADPKRPEMLDDIDQIGNNVDG